MENKHPIDLIIPAPDKSSRWLALWTLLFFIVKGIMLIPHLIVLYFVMIAAMIVAFVSQIVVLFTGEYPKEMHEFVTGALRWQMRVHGYALGLRDEYPPFSLRE